MEGYPMSVYDERGARSGNRPQANSTGGGDVPVQEWQRTSDQVTPLDRMDLGYLLDQLEEVLSSGTRVPLSSRTLVDEQEVLDILDQIRVAVPEEIKAARRI